MKNDETIDNFLRGFGKILDAEKGNEPQPKTTDAPNTKLFMLQMINAYHHLAVMGEPMAWDKTFKHRGTGANYKVTIILEELP